MAVVHLIEIDQVTGDILGDWKNDTSRFDPPIAPPGRAYVDVTSENRGLGDLSSKGYRYRGGRLIEPEQRAPVLDLRSFLRLFTRDEFLTLSDARATDADVRYFWALVEAGSNVDLGHESTVSGIGLFVTRGFLSEARAAQVLAGQPAPR